MWKIHTDHKKYRAIIMKQSSVFKDQNLEGLWENIPYNFVKFWMLCAHEILSTRNVNRLTSVKYNPRETFKSWPSTKLDPCENQYS